MEEKEAKETISDIVAEFREMVHKSVDGIIAVKADVIADRIEAAWKRDRSTQKSENCVEARRDEVVLRLSKEEYKGMQEALSEHDRLCEMLSESRKSVGNAAVMREALKKIYMLAQAVCDDRDEPTMVRHHGNRIERLVNAAISAPPRNCDVGTADEQGRRCHETFTAWRDKFKNDMLIDAVLKWAQMPYEEGGAE